jgi:DNA topoisomerase-6 subunit B
LSPIGEKILTVGMTSEYSIILNKETANSGSQTQLSAKILKPALTAYSSRICVVNNRPTIVECGIAYGGDIPSFKLFRFANKIPLLYDEGSDVAREVISEVGINKMGISKKEVKEQFSHVETKSDRTVEYLPIHIFFHICSTKIPYKTAGKESIASEGDLKKYMKSCLSDLYRKVSAQIRRELKLKEDENKLRLYKHYIPFIINAISESIKIDSKKLSTAFQNLAERYVSGELINITKQIIADSNQKRNQMTDKKNTVNNDNGDESNLNKFDTRTSVSKHGNKTKQDKINIHRKITKK